MEIDNLKFSDSHHNILADKLYSGKLPGFILPLNAMHVVSAICVYVLLNVSEKLPVSFSPGSRPH